KIAIIAGGVFNSGILADPKPGATFDYRAAPAELVTRASRMKSICEQHGVDLKAAAIQFPLRHPAVASVLTGCRSVRELEENVRLFGSRHQEHDEADPRWLLRDDVQRGIASVGSAGLVYDLLVRKRELPAALETVRRHPDVRSVIDHVAKPRIAGGVWDGEWEKLLEPLAQEPNVACKISGL